MIRGLVVTWGHETTSLSQRPQRPRMATAGTIAATAQTGRPTDHLPPAGDRQRHPLRAAHWVHPGGCCPTTCRRGALSSTTSGPGVVMAPGNGYMASCTPSCARLRPVPARPSSTSQTGTKGASGLRRGQEGEGPQAPHRGGYPGAAAGGGSASRRHSGPGRRPVGTDPAAGPFPSTTADLG